MQPFVPTLPSITRLFSLFLVVLFIFLTKGNRCHFIRVRTWSRLDRLFRRLFCICYLGRLFSTCHLGRWFCICHLSNLSLACCDTISLRLFFLMCRFIFHCILFIFFTFSAISALILLLFFLAFIISSSLLILLEQEVKFGKLCHRWKQLLSFWDRDLAVQHSQTLQSLQP